MEKPCFVNNAAGAPKPVGPYSQAVCVGSTVYCAGQIGLDPATGQMVAGGVEAELRQVLANLRAVLIAAGSSPEQIALTTIFLADINDGKVVNPMYAEFVSSDCPPARQTVAVKDLPLGARVEISVIAWR